MRRIRRFVFILSLSVIILLFIINILGYFIPLEFADNHEEDLYEGGIYVVLIAAILLTLTGTLKKTDSRLVIGCKIFLTLFLAMLSVFAAISTALYGMCGYSIVKTLYEKRNDPSEEIVLRDFGCGATDSTPSSMKVQKLKFYTSHFFIAHSVDTTQLNLNEWIKLK